MLEGAKRQSNVKQGKVEFVIWFIDHPGIVDHPWLSRDYLPMDG